MKIDIDSLIAAAVYLDREEEDLCRWEIEAETLSFGLAEATPRELSQRCERLADLRIQVRSLADECSMARRTIDAQDTPALHADLRATVTRISGTARQLDSRMKDFRRRLFELEMELGEIILALHGERVEGALVRLFGNLGRPVREAEMGEALLRDQVDVDAAVARWRRLRGDGSPARARDPWSREDVALALRRLKMEGVAIRHSRMPLRARWTVTPQRPSQLAENAEFTEPYAAPFWHARENVLNAA